MIANIESLQMLPPWEDDVLFEKFITHYFNEFENTTTYDRFGRSGQNQSGLDVYSIEKATVIQCKLKNIGRSDYKIRKELIEDLNKDFDSFIKYKEKNNLAYNRFIFASTFHADTQIQTECAKLSDKSIVVEYWHWDRILNNIPINTFNRYYKQFIEALGDYYNSAVDENNSTPFEVDKSEPLIDQIYSYLKYYFAEIKFLPPHLFKNNYPFKCKDDFIPYYSTFNLQTDNQNLYELLEPIKQNDGKITGIKRKYSEGVKDSKNKIAFILKSLSNNLIFNLENSESRERINIRYIHTKTCSCLSCSLSKLKYSDALKGLKDSPKDIDDKLLFAYVNYELGNYVKSANLYKEIAKQSKDEGKHIRYAVAKFNLSRLYIFIRNKYWGENRRPELLAQLKSIDVLDIYTECKTEHNKSILDWILNINFFTSAKQSIQDIVDRIRDHYYIQQNNGWASNNHIWELITKYAQVDTFINGNYIIYNKFIEYQELTHTFCEGLFLSYSMKDNQTSKLQDFDDWLVQRMIFNGKAEIILKLINRYNIKELSYKNTSEDSGLVLLILNHLSEVDEIQQSINDNCEKGNSSFVGTHNRIFSNLMLLASLCTIDIVDIKLISKKLAQYLKSSSLIDRTNFKYVEIFIANKGEFFEVETLKSILFLQIKNDDIHGLNVRQDVIDCLHKKGELIFTDEEVAELISFAFNNCDSCRRTHRNDFIYKLFSLTDDVFIQEAIRNKVKHILSESFDKNFYYMALLYDILDTTDENFEKFVKHSKPIKSSNTGSSLFGEETYCKQPQINMLLNVCFKHNLDLKNSTFKEYNDLEDYYEWLFNIDDFDYENFNPLWVTAFKTKYYYMHFKKYPIVVEKLLAYLKVNNNVEISQAVADILNAE